MNTLDDLRTSLDRHAESLVDHDLPARPAAVRRRIAVARRRRTAGATGALVVALVVGLGGFLALRQSPDPAPTVFGQQVPLTMRSLGYTYRSTGDTSVFDRRGIIRVAASDQPRLLSWTTDRSTTVRVSVVGQGSDSMQSSFHDYVVLPPGLSGPVVFRVDDGRVAVATYTLGGGPAPAGLTKDGITFRRSVAGTPQLGAVIGDAGQHEVSTSYVAPRGEVVATVLCTDLPKGAVLHVSLAGRDRIFTPCRAGSPFDPGGAGNSGSMFRIGHPGVRVAVRAYVTTGVRSSTPYTGDLGNARIGVGVYGPIRRTRLGGYAVQTEIEAYGRAWRLATTGESAGSPISLAVADPRRPSLATVAFGRVRGPVGFRVGFDRDSFRTSQSGGGHALFGNLMVPVGTRHVRVTMVRGHGGFGAGLYVPVG